MKEKPVLYSVKGHSGAHYMTDIRDTDQGTTVTIQLIGADLPFCANMADLTLYTLEKFEGDLITTLAQEAATIYGADPERVQKAATLARTPYAIQNAQRDFLDNPIKPSIKSLIVKSSKGGWYIVERGQCQCPDNQKGNTCKHRIAAWMHREAIARPLAQARRTTTAKILQELEA